jgi:hypothetical protein
MLIVLPLSYGNAVASSFPVVTPDPQAMAAATQWLAIVDAGNYTHSFQVFPTRIRSGGDAAESSWVSFLRSRRAPLGRPLSRVFVKAQFSRTLAGCPDGNYEFLTYKTSFQRKAQAVEQVTLTKESGRWQVSGYHFK